MKSAFRDTSKNMKSSNIRFLDIQQGTTRLREGESGRRESKIRIGRNKRKRKGRKKTSNATLSQFRFVLSKAIILFLFREKSKVRLKNTHVNVKKRRKFYDWQKRNEKKWRDKVKNSVQLIWQDYVNEYVTIMLEYTQSYKLVATRLVNCTCFTFRTKKLYQSAKQSWRVKNLNKKRKKNVLKNYEVRYGCLITLRLLDVLQLFSPVNCKIFTPLHQTI